MKYALTAKHSLLLCDLILYGVAGTRYFKKALGINYKIPESLVRDHSVFWNYDNDTQYNNALLKNRTLNEAVTHFISSLVSATSLLEKEALAITESEKMCVIYKRVLFSLFDKYYQAYLLNMPFLYAYWNTEHLIITQLKKDFQSIFGDNSEDILRQLLFPAHDTYFVKEKRHMRKIITFIAENKALRAAIIANNSSDKLPFDPYVKYLISK